MSAAAELPADDWTADDQGVVPWTAADSRDLARAERDTRPPLPASVAGAPDGAPVTISGRVASLRRKRTAQGRRWAVATVEDGNGAAVAVVFFPHLYATAGAELAPGRPVTITGRVNRRDAWPSVYAADLQISG